MCYVIVCTPVEKLQ